jgi:hypothetical protein
VNSHLNLVSFHYFVAVVGRYGIDRVVDRRSVPFVTLERQSVAGVVLGSTCPCMLQMSARFGTEIPLTVLPFVVVCLTILAIHFYLFLTFLHWT